MIFFLSISSAVAIMTVFYVRDSRKKRRWAEVSWEELVGKLEAVPMKGIALVAQDYLQPQKGQLAIETDEMWALIGGREGLRRMQANGDILIALAALAQQWNLDESVIVGERMRREGLALRRAAFRVEMGMTFGIGRKNGPFCVQEAASAYYLMRQRLLALYQSSHAGRYPHLVAVLSAVPV